MREKPSSTARLEAFSDGVIAVIITVIVLELKVPHENGPAGLHTVIPILLIYLLSFAFTGIYWINHQHLIERVESADRRILYANLGFLFCLSLLPFFTAYVIEKNIAAFAVALYAVSMIVTGFSFFLLRVAIHRQLRFSGRLQPEDTAERGKHLISLALYLVAAPLAYWHAGLALIVVALVTIIWIIPSLAISKYTK
jgi:uncharacterized membrane protein